MNILDQPRAIEVLQTALAAGRVHHAFVFHGPAGVGKFTTAVAFARVLLCPHAQPDLTGRVTACGSCDSCQRVPADADRTKRLPDSAASSGDKPAEAMGSDHPDLHIVFKELARFSDERTIRERKLSSIPVEVLRSALLEPVSRASHLRHNKVFIIDEAELLAPVAQNLLLKTLEEPPAGTHIILVTSKEHRLLPTIRSRCQRVGFAPVSDETVRQWLGEHYDNLPARQHDWLVAFAEGSLGRAQLAVEYDLHTWAQQIEPALEEMHRGRFPVQLGKLIADAANDFAERWVKAHANASKEAANRQGAALMWSLIAQHARKGLASAAAGFRPGDVPAGEAAAAPWLRTIDALDEAERYLGSNVNMGLVMDHVAVRMSGD